jgi:4-amino-4-deoxy-L-arabinose transferase-like glycosyltransferase
LLNFAAWAVVVWGGWRLARRTAGPIAATIAAPIIAVYPLGVYTAGTFYPQAFGAALLMLGLLLLAEAGDSRRPVLLAGIAGLVFGLLIVTLPTFVYVLVLGVAWWALSKRPRAAAIALLALAAVVPLSWTLRNALSMDGAVPITTNSGLNLLLGYSEHAGVRTGANVGMIEKYVAEASARHLNEVQADRFFRRSAIDWIEAHPGRAAELYAGKNLDYFAPFDKLYRGEQSSKAYNVLAAVSYLPFLVLFVVRLAFWRRYRPGSFEQLLIAVYVIGAPVAAVFFTRVRFRVPADPVLLLVVAGLVAAWLRGGLAGTSRSRAGN